LINELMMVETNKNNVSPLLLPPEDAAKLLGISRSQFYRLHSAGKIPLPIRSLGRPLWSRKELESWVDTGCPGREQWLEMKTVGASRN